MTTVTVERTGNSEARRDALGSRVIPRWVESLEAAKKAAQSEDASIVWIVAQEKLANYLATELAKTRFTGKSGKLVLLKHVRLPLIIALGNRFRKVAFPSSALPKGELNLVLQAPDRSDRFVGGVIDEPSKTVTLWKGDLRPLIIPFHAFRPTANGIRPDFEKFSVIDYGYTLKFGEYEAAADAVLYEYDPQFRRRMKKRRVAEEQTLGASIRRLRMQRQLTRNDFPEIDPKTLARIENGQISRPRPGTLEKIAKRLDVRPEQLESY